MCAGIFQHAQAQEEDSSCQLALYVQPFTPCQLRFAVLLFLDGWLMPLAAAGMAVAMGERLHRMACLLSSSPRAEQLAPDCEGPADNEECDEGDSFLRGGAPSSSCRLRGGRGRNDEDEDEHSMPKGEDPGAVLDMFRRAQQNSMRHEPAAAAEDDVVAMFRKAQAAAAAAGADPRLTGERLGEML